MDLKIARFLVFIYFCFEQHFFRVAQISEACLNGALIKRINNNKKKIIIGDKKIGTTKYSDIDRSVDL